MKTLGEYISESIFDDQDASVEINSQIKRINSNLRLLYKIDGIEHGMLIAFKSRPGPKLWIGSELNPLEGLVKGIVFKYNTLRTTSSTPTRIPIYAMGFNVAYAHPDLHLTSNGNRMAFIERDALKTGITSITNAESVHLKIRDYEDLDDMKNLRLPDSKDVLLHITNGYLIDGSLDKDLDYLFDKNEQDSTLPIPDRFKWLKYVDKNVKNVELSISIPDNIHVLFEFSQQPFTSKFFRGIFAVSWKKPVRGWYLRITGRHKTS